MNLIETTDVKIRFSEVDSMGVVWHGSYLKYLEDGREAFGEKYGLTYLDIYKNGVFAPLVDINIQYKQPLKYGDKIAIETKYVDSQAAKIIFEYKIYRKPDYKVVILAKTTQVFLDKKNNNFLITTPEFFKIWKEKVLK